MKPQAQMKQADKRQSIKSHPCPRCGNNFLSLGGGRCYPCSQEVIKENIARFKSNGR